MEWLYYLLEANLYLLIFYAFYKLFLHNETFYHTNRYFLLLASATAFVLPILQLGFLKPTPITDNVVFPMPVVTQNGTMLQLATTQTTTTDYTTYCYAIYLCIAIGLALKLMLSVINIIKLWGKAHKTTAGKVTVVELQDQKTAFSFFNLLFIHPQLAKDETVFKHEMVHIKQKHSFDILFFEVLQIICWFNPIIYFIKNDVKLLHEYIADELSTTSGMHKHAYALFLISNSFGVIPTPLTNQIFNQSILKRRINMLNKKRTATWARLRLLLALPLTGGMLCISTMAFTKTYGYVDLLPEKSNTALALVQEAPQVKQQNQVKFPPPQVAINRAGQFIPRYSKNAAKEPVMNEKRYIVINGNAIKDFNQFYGVYNADKINYLAQKDAMAKYGELAKNGAVEITGKQIKYFDHVVISPPPPIEPPKSKKAVVKFPPPIVKPGKPVSSSAPNDQEEKVVQGYATKPKGEITVQGYPTNAQPKKAEKITVQGYATKAKDEIVVQGYGTKPKDEITVQGYGTKPKDEITVQGYPTPAKEKKQATITVQGYRTKSNNDNGSDNQNNASNPSSSNSVYPASGGNANSNQVNSVYASPTNASSTNKVRGILIEATGNTKTPLNKVTGIKIKPVNASEPLNKTEVLQVFPAKTTEKPNKNNK